MRLIASAPDPVVSSLDASEVQAGSGNADDGAAPLVVDPRLPSPMRGHTQRYWRVGCVLALLMLLGIGATQGRAVVHEMQAQHARLAVAVAQQQAQLQALSFTLQALRTEFGIVTEELVSDRTGPAPHSDPAALAAVSLSPTETRSLTSLVEQVTTHGTQLTALAKEITQLRSPAPIHERPVPSRYRAASITQSELLPPSEPPPAHAVTLPPALGAVGFTPARPRRTTAGR
jgi:hypothetical protein